MSSTGGFPTQDGVVSVVPEDIRRFGQQLSDLVQTLSSAVDTASREVDSVVESWRGTSADAFSEEWDAVYGRGSQLLISLAGMAESLGVVADSYQRQDEASASALRPSSLDL